MDDLRPIAAILQSARAHETHVRLFTNAELAAGFDCPEGNIRTWKSRNQDDLKQDIHWITDEGKTWWTARGVIQLGFRLESPRATEFRAAVEDLVMAVSHGSEPINSDVTLSNTPVTLPSIAESIARQSVANQLADLTVRAQARILQNPDQGDLDYLAQRLQSAGFSVNSVMLQAAIGLSLPGGDA